jgi:cytochrome c-type biogenesis protein CcmH
MTLFWALAAALTAVALAFLLPPLLRRRSAAPDARVAANAEIYREQIEEIGAELQRGALTQEEFQRASREIERRIVAEHADSGPAPATHRPPLAAAIAVGVLLPLMAALAYWQLGNPEGFSGAASKAEHTVTQEQVESLVQRLAARMEQTPDDAEGWMLLARSLSVLGQHERSAQAYARAVQLSPNDAGMLADYADTLAMARGGNLEGEPLALVQRALKIDPQHVKALALAGTAQFDRGDYAAAIGYWEQLLKITPPESEFARSVAGSIAEARSLAGGPIAKAKPPAAAATPATPATPAPGRGQSLQGTVSIDPALAARLSPGDTVFVLARPVSGSRMPLAIARTTVAALPYRFTLDDSMAMAPGATISSHAQVVVAARVSKSGSAAPAKGDVEGASAPVAPGAVGVNVVLSRIVD